MLKRTTKQALLCHQHPARIHAGGMLVVILLGGVVVGTSFYAYANQHSWGRVDFQEYALDYLAGDLTVGKTIDARYVPASRTPHTTTLHLQLADDNYVYESREAEPFQYICAHPAEDEQCAVLTSPKDQRYVLTTVSAPGQAVSQSIEWTVQNTNLQVHLGTPGAAPYSQDALNKIVDSATPTYYPDVPVRYIDDSQV